MIKDRADCFLLEAVARWPEFDGDDDVNGGDLVEWFGEWRERVVRYLDPPSPALDAEFKATLQRQVGELKAMFEDLQREKRADAWPSMGHDDERKADDDAEESEQEYMERMSGFVRLFLTSNDRERAPDVLHTLKALMAECGMEPAPSSAEWLTVLEYMDREGAITQIVDDRESDPDEAVKFKPKPGWL